MVGGRGSEVGVGVSGRWSMVGSQWSLIHRLVKAAFLFSTNTPYKIII